MGLEFLQDHGGRRVRSYPDQPGLELPEEPDNEEGPGVEDVDHDYEGRDWAPIGVEGTDVDWDEAPRRFVDGCHVGHTIAWLQDAEGHPIPLMLSEIGGVCVERDGRELRRAFQVVERVVAMIVDPFAWDEVEAFAIALAGSGFRLLPTLAPEREDGSGWAASYDFEAMRKKTQNRSNYEGLQRCSIVGGVKQQRKGYLHTKGGKAFYRLEPGQRTPAFVIATKSVPVVSWYLKLDGAHGALPNWGVVRVEIPRVYFEERAGKDFALVDRLSNALIQMRCRLGSYSRGPVSLTPIVRAEEALRSLFAPASQLAQQFYRMTRI